MVKILFLAMSFVILFDTGSLFSLPVLIPPIRQKLRQNPTLRWVSVGFISLITTLAMIWMFAYLPAHNASFTTPQISGVNYDWLRSATAQELWERTITPPFVAQPCYSDNSYTCRSADMIEAHGMLSRHQQYLGSYLTLWLLILTPTLAAGFCVILFTRDNRKQKA